MDMTYPSLYFHRVESDAAASIRSAIQKLKLGKIRCVNVVSRNKTHDNGKCSTYYSAYVHFKEWNREDIRLKLMEGQDIKIVHDAPWFWKVVAATSPNQRRKV